MITLLAALLIIAAGLALWFFILWRAAFKMLRAEIAFSRSQRIKFATIQLAQAAAAFLAVKYFNREK